MDRKKFLRLSCTSAMAGMALAALPKAVRGQGQPVTNLFIGTWSESEDIEVHLTLYSESIQNYAKFAEYRTVNLKLVKYLENTNGNSEKSEELLNAVYVMRTPPRRLNGGTEAYRVEAELTSVETNSRNVPLSQLVFDIDFREGNDVAALRLAGRTITLQESDTFICTACIKARELSKNCRELNILRSFRNEYAMQTTEGRQLIRAYATVGPMLVGAIEHCENRNEIYDSVYSSLVEPAIALIREGRKEAAMVFYKKYVEGLQEILINR